MNHENRNKKEEDRGYQSDKNHIDDVDGPLWFVARCRNQDSSVRALPRGGRRGDIELSWVMLVGGTAPPKVPLKTVRADVLVALGAQRQAGAAASRARPVTNTVLPLAVDHARQKCHDGECRDNCTWKASDLFHHGVVTVPSN
jgi:hypothetical protein